MQDMVEGKITCGIYKADKTLCENPVEDIITDGQGDIIPLCVSHSQRLETGSAFMVRTLSNKDILIQFSVNQSSVN